MGDLRLLQLVEFGARTLSNFIKFPRNVVYRRNKLFATTYDAPLDEADGEGGTKSKNLNFEMKNLNFMFLVQF